MRRGAVICLVLAVTACGPPERSDPTSARQTDIRNPPGTTSPGVQVSGHVNVGVVHSF
jgi:hypothetical protein